MMHDDLLVVELVVTGDTARARLDGEVDLSNAERLDRCARAIRSPDAEIRRLVLDLRRVTFCDGAGLKALLRVWQAAGEHGIGCEILPSTAVSFLLEVTDARELLADVSVR